MLKVVYLVLAGEDKKQPLFSELREFDPIKQHRPFCPWILANAKFTPGWRQTLTALQGRRESNFLLGMPSSSLMEVNQSNYKNKDDIDFFK